MTKYVTKIESEFSFRDLNCKQVKLYLGILYGLLSLMNLLDMLVSHSPSFPTQNRRYILFQFELWSGCWLSPSSYGYDAHQFSGQINFHSYCSTGLSTSKFIYKINCNICWNGSKKQLLARLIPWLIRACECLTLLLSETPHIFTRAEQISVLNLIFSPRNCGACW